jgi:DNA-binding NtrC family response regulator
MRSRPGVAASIEIGNTSLFRDPGSGEIVPIRRTFGRQTDRCEGGKMIDIDEGLLVAVADDEPSIREVLSMRLESWGYRVCTAENGEQAAQVVEQKDPDLVISDVVMPQLSGLELLSALRGGRRDRPVVLITAFGDVDMAVEAMKRGARDFLTKPLDYDNLQAMLADLSDEIRQSQRIRAWQVQLESGVGPGSLIGQSARMREVFRLVELVASSEASALILGESGTGKEVVARAIHELSARSKGPFVAVNSAAIPESLMESEIFGHEKGAFTGATSARPGCFELANKGTLFLDEIGEMPISLQPKLLRILEQHSTRRLGGSREVSIDVRLLAATNSDAGSLVSDGMLREDLYYRLNVFTIVMPPLRERVEDLPLLALQFLKEANERHGTGVDGLSEGALETLESYRWPGNVRELRNVLERAAVLAGSGWVEESHLPSHVQRETESQRLPEITIRVGTSAADAERKLILKTLEHVGQNKAEAARQLGLDPKTIRNKLKAYGLS